MGREQLILLAASPVVARVFAASPLSRALDKTAMLRRLIIWLNRGGWGGGAKRSDSYVLIGYLSGKLRIFCAGPVVASLFLLN